MSFTHYLLRRNIYSQLQLSYSRSTRHLAHSSIPCSFPIPHISISRIFLPAHPGSLSVLADSCKRHRGCTFAPKHHPKNSWEGCSVVQGENCILPIPSKESEFVNTDDIYTIFFVAFISCTTPTLRCVCLE